MKITISLGSSRKSTDWKPITTEWGALVEKLASPKVTSETMEEYAAMDKEARQNAKDIGGFIGGYVKGTRKLEDVSSRSVITLDADYAPADFWDLVCGLYDGAACVYSTHSHTPESPRYRLLIPLSHPVGTTEYEAIARMVAKDTGIEYYDDTTYDQNRLMFWPSVCKDGKYEYYVQDGEALRPESILSRYHDWHDEAEWPRSERVKDKLRRSREKMGEPTEKPGIIGAFCRTYSISEAIEKFLPEYFEPAGQGRYTYKGGTTYAGAVVYEDKFIFSHHAHDPYHGREMNAYDMVRCHLFGYLDKDAPEGTALKDLPSTKEMKKLCMDDEAVMNDVHSQAVLVDDEGNIMFDMHSDYSDSNVAEHMARTLRGRLLYHESLGWLTWTGEYWKSGNFADALKVQLRFYDRLMAQAIRNLEEAKLLGDAELKAATYVHKKVTAMRNGSKINAVEHLLRGKLALDSTDALDPDKWCLNTPAGLIDLKTGTICEHKPEQMCSHITSVSPAPGKPEMWLDALNYWCRGDQALIDYLQLVVGMCCVGELRNEGMVMVYGPGGNGKSTMFNTISAILGGYATVVRSSVLVEKHNGADPFGLDVLRGARMAIMSELDEGVRLSVSTMKSITSRDVIQVNPKYAKLFSFTPSHTLILHTNYLPKLGQLDLGTLRRIAVVPFKAEPKAPGLLIPDLADQLINKEGPQILNWMIQGAMAYWRSGCVLVKPKAVVDETGAYTTREDWMRSFLEERCIVEEGARCAGGELYAEYRRWAAENGEYIRRNRDFAAELETRGFTKSTIKGCRVWRGLRLSAGVVGDLSDGEDEEDKI